MKLSPEAQPGVSRPSIPFRLTVLGELRLDGSEGELLPRQRKELALLAWLAYRRMAVLREEAAAAFWGDAHATQSLGQAVASIRRAAPEALDLAAESIRARFDALAVDALEMETAFAEGRLTDGLALWTGDFMPRTEELGTEPFRVWLEAERERLRIRVCNAFERVVAAAEGAATQLDWAERWAAAFPLDERAHVYLLGALEHAGRADEALERHGEFAVRYAAEAGMELSGSVREMVESIHRSPRRAVAHLPGSTALFTPDMTGRDAEIEALEAAWSDARGTGGIAVVIEGARGTGRTRLITEFARQIRRGGRCVVLEARSASDGDTNSPCRALIAPLASAPGIAACSPAALEKLASELPELRASRDLPPAVAPADLAGAVREVVECVAEKTPVLVVVDDASQLSREVGSIIARLVRTPPPSVLVLLTAHPGALDDSDCGRALRESTRSRRIKLRPLDTNQVEVMIASMIPIAASDRQRLTSILDAETGGNPLQVCDCISVFADTGVLALDHNGLWRLSKGRGPASLPLPASMIRTRLEHLSPAARAVAEAVAGTKIRFDSAQLVDATGLTDADVEAALGELVGRRLLRPLRESSAYEFTSDEVRRHVAVPPAAAARSRPRAARPRRRLLLTAVGAVAAVLAILAARTALPASSVARPERVIVLPFANETGIPALDAIGVRAADQLTRELAGLRRISVAPTPRVDGRREALDAAREARATLAFSGVMRAAGDSLTLSAVLIDVSDGEESLVLPPVQGTIGGADALVQVLTDRARAALAARVDRRSPTPH